MREKLDELARLHAAATPGEWRGDRIDRTVKYGISVGEDGHLKPVFWFDFYPDDGNNEEDFNAVIAIHNAFSALLEYVRELESERDEARAQLVHWKKQHDIELLSADKLADQLAVARNNARHYAAKCVELEAQLKRGKSEALREFAKSRDIEVIGNGDWYGGIQAERTATVEDLRETADRLEKEATDGR